MFDNIELKVIVLLVQRKCDIFSTIALTVAFLFIA
jgi:hypothetical protein